MIACLPIALAVMAKPGPVRDFPAEWGEPPAQQTMDFVPLSGGYGHGSSTVDEWIKKKMHADMAERKPKYPPEWGSPPMIQTRDLRQLPFGYGSGSSTMVKWIIKQAREFSDMT